VALFPSQLLDDAKAIDTTSPPCWLPLHRAMQFGERLASALSAQKGRSRHEVEPLVARPSRRDSTGWKRLTEQMSVWT